MLNAKICVHFILNTAPKAVFKKNDCQLFLARNLPSSLLKNFSQLSWFSLADLFAKYGDKLFS